MAESRSEGGTGDRYESEGAGPQLFYNERVVDHFRNPRNVGELPAAANVASAVVGDPACGDQMKLWIEVSSTSTRCGTSWTRGRSSPA